MFGRARSTRRLQQRIPSLFGGGEIHSSSNSRYGPQRANVTADVGGNTRNFDRSSSRVPPGRESVQAKRVESSHVALGGSNSSLSREESRFAYYKEQSPRSVTPPSIQELQTVHVNHTYPNQLRQGASRTTRANHSDSASLYNTSSRAYSEESMYEPMPPRFTSQPSNSRGLTQARRVSGPSASPPLYGSPAIAPSNRIYHGERGVENCYSTYQYEDSIIEAMPARAYHNEDAIIEAMPSDTHIPSKKKNAPHTATATTTFRPIAMDSYEQALARKMASFPKPAPPTAKTTPSTNSIPIKNSTDTHNWIEIAPGVTARLRGAQETMNGIANDFYLPCECYCCQADLFCIMDADFVLCPVCKVVSPVAGGGTGDSDYDNNEKNDDNLAGGVGLGFTLDDLQRYQSEILRGR